MRRLASIEIGSNSIRMLIAEAGKSDGPLRPILRRRAITRLGEDFNRHDIGTIKAQPVERSIAALGNFIGIASEFGVSTPIVVATGAVRDAVNGGHLITLIAERLGHTAKIISGQQEAELTCKGVLSSLNHQQKPLVIFDLGGGSTEFIWINSERGSISVELGAVILTEDYLITDPPKDHEIQRLSSHIEAKLQSRLAPLKQRGVKRFSMVGTGGTIVALARMTYGIAEDDLNATRLNGLVLSRHDIGLLFELMKGIRKEKRLNLKGLEVGRQDTILAGTLVTMKIMDCLAKDETTVSYSDLLEGILIHYLEGEDNG
jgi:exopolyphosphatase/guanosine-5'-triphosphate,3'-diphosphate pyrophosphatase